MNVRQEIVNILSDYADGTYSGLDGAHFVEWLHDVDSPVKECADRLEELFNKINQNPE